MHSTLKLGDSMMVDSLKNDQDRDPIETQEWLDSLEAVIDYQDLHRAEFLLSRLLKHAAEVGISVPADAITPYTNTIAAEQESSIPEDVVLMNRVSEYLRWNALAMVMRVAAKKEGLGGHISTYASIATLVEVGLNYFFSADDLIFFQGHSAEGIYARAFLEGRITEEHLLHFRQEAFSETGLSSYPHPYLMPNFWQFPTVSMGLGPLMAIYQAQLLKYLHHRGLLDTAHRKVWAFCGDGEMGEPESLGALLVASQEKLSNLIFVINCNLQRLDGPVLGNGKIIQALEGIYRGAGWRVIKVIWGSNWDPLLQQDASGLLLQRMGELVDGEYQNFSAHDGAYMRENFFGKYPELLALVAGMSDEALKALIDGGHDPQKIYAAYKEAQKDCGRPTVILAKTVKGFGYGEDGEGKNITHNLESLTPQGLKIFRDRFNLPLTDQQLKTLDFLKFDEKSDEFHYIKDRRAQLGGPLPARNAQCKPLTVPALDRFDALLKGSGERALPTGLAFSRIMMVLLKDPAIKDRVVPIVADEARTLGLEGLFRQTGIYAVEGQKYTPEDAKKLVTYREDQTGQLLQQGISEGGAMASWIAAATAYANHHYPLIPIYTYYAMFGYQRVGDLVWAGADMQARGFIMGGLAGRTTLPGEGLQHQDSHNLLMYGLVPSCRAYDPAFGYELAVIMQDGLKRMMQDQEHVFYYITLMNEAYRNPPMPKGVEKGIVDGMYLFRETTQTSKKMPMVQLLGAGAILLEVIKAADILEKTYHIAANIWSVTSFNLLRRDIESVARFNRLHPDQPSKSSLVETLLSKQKGPVIAATDYVKLMAHQIRSAIDKPYFVLGTDGFGRSDTRSALRRFFEVDAAMIVYTALQALSQEGAFNSRDLMTAMKKLKIDPDRPDPWTV